ncbi:hypothetical protein EVAR_47041_1 [Eumeta japonica]|uniref:Tc1-like transposase DDE domain-containing protein n=1 Tax=Eumeta variegata TaxID=151549 RepID=A0A4C1XJC5_EUMVA|nr:hypothetical protein EVAR_47041_1 [Eumeta japonica]
MKDEKCSKRYLKSFLNETVTGENGHLKYRQRSPEPGGFIAKTNERAEIPANKKNVFILASSAIPVILMDDGRTAHSGLKFPLIVADYEFSDPETKQHSTVWVFQDEPNPIKVIRAKSNLKQMIACFFGINGHVVTVLLENRKTVDSELYRSKCFLEIFEEIRKNKRLRRIILRHENASCHASAETIRSLEGQKIELTGYPTYILDLTSNDFHLFPYVKNKLRYVVNVYRAAKRALMRFKCMFWSAVSTLTGFFGYRPRDPVIEYVRLSISNRILGGARLRRTRGGPGARRLP